jgi:hypothetical protein
MLHILSTTKNNQNQMKWTVHDMAIIKNIDQKIQNNKTLQDNEKWCNV